MAYTEEWTRKELAKEVQIEDQEEVTEEEEEKVEEAAGQKAYMMRQEKRTLASVEEEL